MPHQHRMHSRATVRSRAHATAIASGCPLARLGIVAAGQFQLKRRQFVNAQAAVRRAQIKDANHLHVVTLTSAVVRTGQHSV